MIDKVHRTAERMWAIVAMAALALAFYDLYNEGWQGGRMSLLFPAIAGAWYWTRRSLRKKLESSSARSEEIDA